MVTYGDGLSSINIDDLVAFHKSHDKIVTFSGVHSSGRFGEFEEKNNEVLSFKEKPSKGRAYINGGYMVFNRSLLNYLTTDENCDFGFNALEKLAKIGQVRVYKKPEKLNWHDKTNFVGAGETEKGVLFSYISN
jgi:glucose-1-phosphate cytidylyltransferase